MGDTDIPPKAGSLSRPRRDWQQVHEVEPQERALDRWMGTALLCFGIVALIVSAPELLHRGRAALLEASAVFDRATDMMSARILADRGR